MIEEVFDVWGAGHALRRIREDKRLTQVDVAKGSGLNYMVISRIESGLLARPPMEALCKLGTFYGLDANQIAALFHYPQPIKSG